LTLYRGGTDTTYSLVTEEDSNYESKRLRLHIKAVLKVREFFFSLSTHLHPRRLKIGISPSHLGFIFGANTNFINY